MRAPMKQGGLLVASSSFLRAVAQSASDMAWEAFLQALNLNSEPACSERNDDETYCCIWSAMLKSKTFHVFGSICLAKASFALRYSVVLTYKTGHNKSW